MTTLKIKNEQGQWEKIPTVKGDKGDRGEDGAELLMGSIIAWEGDSIPDGYEETDAPIKAIANIFFPIGYAFIDKVGTADYSNHLGLTWEKSTTNSLTLWTRIA